MPSTATFLYDRTFDGLLTAVFDAFVRKQLPSAIKGEDEPLPLFHDEVFTVVSDEEKAGRVLFLPCHTNSNRNICLPFFPHE